MRRLALLLLLACLLPAARAVPASAAFTLPSEVYRMDELDDALRYARSSRLPVAFLYTDESSSCGLCRAASLDAARELREDAVIVYVDSKEEGEWLRLPPLAARAIADPRAGRFIPKVAVLDPSLGKVLAVLPYVRDPQARAARLREAAAALRE